MVYHGCHPSGRWLRNSCRWLRLCITGVATEMFYSQLLCHCITLRSPSCDENSFVLFFFVFKLFFFVKLLIMIMLASAAICLLLWQFASLIDHMTIRRLLQVSFLWLMEL